jgi:hypothetical protein
MRKAPPPSLRSRILLGVLLLPLRLAGSDPIDTLEKSAVDWGKIRAETVRLESDEASELQLLQSTIGAEKERVRLLEERRDSLQALSADDTRDADLAAKSDAARASLAAADKRLKGLSDSLVQLRPWLPPRLSKALELPYRSLANPLLTVGERMQLVSTVLNRCAQFNQAIVGGDEALNVGADPGPRVMEIVYWGLAQAYALDRNTGNAYLGFPGEQGWVWEAHPELVDPVSRLIAIYKDKADPEFVEIPASLRGPWQPKPAP